MSKSFVMGVQMITVTDPDTGAQKNVPDLELNIRDYITKISTDVYSISWKTSDNIVHSLLMHHIGFHDTLKVHVFVCQGSELIIDKLSHLGAKILLLRNLRERPALLTWLRDNGLRVLRRVSDGTIISVVPNVTIAGSEIISSTLDNNWKNDLNVDDEYEIVEASVPVFAMKQPTGQTITVVPKEEIVKMSRSKKIALVVGIGIPTIIGVGYALYELIF